MRSEKGRTRSGAAGPSARAQRSLSARTARRSRRAQRTISGDGWGAETAASARADEPIHTNAPAPPESEDREARARAQLAHIAHRRHLDRAAAALDGCSAGLLEVGHRRGGPREDHRALAVLRDPVSPAPGRALREERRATPRDRPRPRARPGPRAACRGARGSGPPRRRGSCPGAAGEAATGRESGDGIGSSRPERRAGQRASPSRSQAAATASGESKENARGTALAGPLAHLDEPAAFEAQGRLHVPVLRAGRPRKLARGSSGPRAGRADPGREPPGRAARRPVPRPASASSSARWSARSLVARKSRPPWRAQARPRRRSPEAPSPAPRDTSA